MIKLSAFCYFKTSTEIICLAVNDSNADIGFDNRLELALIETLTGRNNLKNHAFSKELLRDVSNFETSSSICLSVMMNGGASNT